MDESRSSDEAMNKSQRSTAHGEADVSENNVRIPMNVTKLDEVDDDEEVEEEDQDQVLDRDDVKKNSSMVLEKVNKKTKRKIKGSSKKRASK